MVSPDQYPGTRPLGNGPERSPVSSSTTKTKLPKRKLSSIFSIIAKIKEIPFKPVLAGVLLTAVSSVGVPKNTASAVRNFSPAAAAALENMGPRSASADTKKEEQLKFSPSQLKEMERYGVEPELQTKIDESIDKGVAFLISNFDSKKKSWPKLFNDKLSIGGQHALATLALLASGQDPESDIVQEALKI